MAPTPTIAKYQRQVFYGNAGATADTQVKCTTEAEVRKTKDYDPTTVNGDGTEIPIETEQAVRRKCEVTFKCRRETAGDNSTALAALLAAATHASNPLIAIKVLAYAGGPTEFDGDVTLDVEDPDSRELSFTCHLSKGAGRSPVF